MTPTFSLHDFVRESNRIEGIHRAPLEAEIAAHVALLDCPRLRASDIANFVSVVARGARLRDAEGMDVRVGSHVPPRGGLHIAHKLNALLDDVNANHLTPFAAHVRYECLHPFMDGNGRSGRALWLWMMHGEAPLGFLHHFYYQTLTAQQSPSPLTPSTP